MSKFRVNVDTTSSSDSNYLEEEESSSDPNQEEMEALRQEIKLGKSAIGSSKRYKPDVSQHTFSEEKNKPEEQLVEDSDEFEEVTSGILAPLTIRSTQ